MADEAEVLIPEMDQAPGAEQHPDDAPQVELTEIEKIASAVGWAQPDKWQGHGEWKDAVTFLTETAQSAAEAKKQAKTLKRTLETTTRTMERTLEDQRRQAFDEAQRLVDRAVAENDAPAARQALKRVQEIEASRPAPAVQTFLESNSHWFNVDPEATAYAKSVSDMQAAAGASPAEQVTRAEAAVRKRFPEHFEDAPEPTPERTAPKAPAMGGGQRTASSRKGPMTLADLPKEAQASARRFEKKGVPLSEFIKTYAEENGQ